MNDSFDEQELTQFLQFQSVLEQEAAAAIEEERERERLFTARMVEEGMPVETILQALVDNPDLSLIGLEVDLGRELDQFAAAHPDVIDDTTPFTLEDITFEKMTIVYGHCRVLAQFESAHSLYEDAPSTPDLLKEVQYEILNNPYISMQNKILWNNIAVRYMPSESINMRDPARDAYVIAKRREEQLSAARIKNHSNERKTIYELLRENGDALGLRSHDDSQVFISRVATAIIYEHHEFAEFQRKEVYEIGERLGLTSEQIKMIYDWTYAQVRRTW